MAFGDVLDLRFRIRAEGSDAEKEVARVQKAVSDVSKGVGGNLGAAFREANKEGSGFLNVLTQVRIGLTQLARGDLGGIPNLAKGMTLLKGGGDQAVKTLRLVDAALLLSGEKTLKAADLFKKFQDNLAEAALGATAFSRTMRLQFEAVGISVEQALLKPDSAFEQYLKKVALIDPASREAASALDLVGVSGGEAARGVQLAGQGLTPLATGFSTLAKVAGAAGVVIVAAIIAVATEIAIAKKLTSEMLERVKEIGTKSRKEFEEFAKGVRAAGGTVTTLDRALSQTILTTLDRVKGAADRMFIDVIRLSGPAFIVLLRKVADLIIAIGPLATLMGKFLVINFIAAAASAQTFIDVLKLIPNALKSGSLTEFFATLALGIPQFQANVRRIKAEIEGLKLETPTFDDKKTKDRAENASRTRIRILEIEAQAAKRIFDEETADAERAYDQRAISAEELAKRLIASEQKLLAARQRIFEAEKAEAQTGDLPENQKAVKLAEIREKELQALSDYNAAVRKARDDARKSEDESIRATLQFYQDVFEARRRLNQELRSLATEAREVQLEIDRARLRTLQQNPQTRKRALDEQARIEVEAELLRRERFLQSLDDQKAELLAKAQTEQERLDIEQRFFELEEAEFRRHQNVIETITEETKQAKERADPFSARSIFGEDFANVLAEGGSQLQAFGALFAGTFDQMARSALNVQNIITAFTGALTSMLAQLILTGKGGAQAFKSLAAAIIAEVVVTSAIKALQMVAKGVEYASEATAAFAAGDFVAGTFFSIASGHAFKSAALYGAIAGGGAIAGVALAASGGGGGGGSAGSQFQENTKPRDVTINRGGSPEGSLGVGTGGQDILPGSIFARIGTAIENLDNKISSMRPGDVVTVGSAQSPDAIGRAVVSEARRSAEFTNDFGRLLAGPV